MAASTRSEPAAAGQEQTLKKNAIGVASVVFAVVAMAAPLTATVANTPIEIGFGNGAGGAGAYLLAGIVLAIFGVGYAAMSRHITNAGAFYAYVTEGLGRRNGMAAGFLAVFCYNFQVVFVFGLVGVFTKGIIDQELGLSLPWWVCGGVGLMIAYLCAIRGVDVSAKVLGVSLILETSLLFVLAGAVLVNQGFGAYSLTTFSPSTVFSGAPGVALAFAFLSYIGFEATAILSEETKNPRKTVARATYIAVAVITVIYVISTWAVIASFGSDKVKAAAEKDPGNLVVSAMRGELGGWAGHTMNWLLLISLLAVFIAIHNMASRYLFSFGRARIMPAALGRTHPRYQSPHVAGTVQALFTVAIVVAFAISGADPYLDMAAVLGSLTALGIIFLQAGAAASVIGYFRGHRDRDSWTTIIAPAIATVALTIVGILVISNFDLVTGKQSSFVANLPWALLAIAVIGWVVAWLRPELGTNAGVPIATVGDGGLDMMAGAAIPPHPHVHRDEAVDQTT